MANDPQTHLTLTRQDSIFGGVRDGRNMSMPERKVQTPDGVPMHLAEIFPLEPEFVKTDTASTVFDRLAFGGKKLGSTTLRVPESSLTSVLTKPVVA